MKALKDVTACVVDYGSFQCVAEKLAESYSKVYYYAPFEAEFLDAVSCARGDGMPNVERVEDYLDPEFLRSVDLFVFPDRGYGGVQRHLREDMGKAVWGSMGFCLIEECRSLFVDLLKKLKMPQAPFVQCNGFADLADHLRGVTDKWVKIDRYRACMETWHHLDMVHSEDTLARMAKRFGPTREQLVFIVQDPIDTDVEVGYDGWSVDGRFPKASFQGYEAKNELYLGSLRTNEELPEEVAYVNKKLAPLLKQYGYRNFWSTEIRVKDGTPFFIDPTVRMPGQTGEQLLETCENLAEVIWAGANGDLVEPEFAYTFAAEATLHYTGSQTPNEWRALHVPSGLSRWVKLYHYCVVDGVARLLPHEGTDEVGVVLGVGDTAEDAIEHLKANIELLDEEPVHTEIRDFAELLKKIESAEEQGVPFSDEPLPEASIVL